MTRDELQFRTIDLDSHADLCVTFRRDSFVCSFGSAERFDNESGPNGERYVHWLRQLIANFPEGYVHVWQGDEIIGQMEMRLLDEPGNGYVNLYYLVPEARGTGAGDALHSYVENLFRSHGVNKVRLSVSPTNHRALKYYRKHGWTDLGPRPGHEEVHLMELELGAAA